MHFLDCLIISKYTYVYACSVDFFSIIALFVVGRKI